MSHTATCYVCDTKGKQSGVQTGEDWLLLSFPEKKEDRQKWLSCVGLDAALVTKMNRNAQICNRHFLKDAIEKSKNGFLVKTGCLPSQFLDTGLDRPIDENPERNNEPNKRTPKKKQASLFQSCVVVVPEQRLKKQGVPVKKFIEICDKMSVTLLKVGNAYNLVGQMESLKKVEDEISLQGATKLSDSTHNEAALKVNYSPSPGQGKKRKDTCLENSASEKNNPNNSPKIESVPSGSIMRTVLDNPVKVQIFGRNEDGSGDKPNFVSVKISHAFTSTPFEQNKLMDLLKSEPKVSPIQAHKKRHFDRASQEIKSDLENEIQQLTPQAQSTVLNIGDSTSSVKSYGTNSLNNAVLNSASSEVVDDGTLVVATSTSSSSTSCQGMKRPSETPIEELRGMVNETNILCKLLKQGPDANLRAQLPGKTGAGAKGNNALTCSSLEDKFKPQSQSTPVPRRLLKRTPSGGVLVVHGAGLDQSEDEDIQSSGIDQDKDNIRNVLNLDAKPVKTTLTPKVKEPKIKSEKNKSGQKQMDNDQDKPHSKGNNVTKAPSIEMLKVPKASSSSEKDDTFYTNSSKPFTCPLCSQNMKASVAVDHMADMHPGANTDFLKCGICSRTFKNLDDMRPHFRTCLKESTDVREAVKGGYLICLTCKIRLYTYLDYMVHCSSYKNHEYSTHLLPTDEVIKYPILSYTTDMKKKEKTSTKKSRRKSADNAYRDTTSNSNGKRTCVRNKDGKVIFHTFGSETRDWMKITGFCMQNEDLKMFSVKYPRDMKYIFKCDVCGFRSTKKGVIAHRRNIHFPNETVCDICDNVDLHSRFYSNHLNKHFDENGGVREVFYLKDAGVTFLEELERNADEEWQWDAVTLNVHFTTTENQEVNSSDGGLVVSEELRHDKEPPPKDANTVTLAELESTVQGNFASEENMSPSKYISSPPKDCREFSGLGDSMKKKRAANGGGTESSMPPPPLFVLSKPPECCSTPDVMLCADPDKACLNYYKDYLTQTMDHEHKGNILFKCKVCQEIVNSGSALSHMFRYHFPEHSFRCKICMLPMTAEVHLLKHLGTKHFSITTGEYIERFVKLYKQMDLKTPCDSCGKTFTIGNSYRMHKQKCQKRKTKLEEIEKEIKETHQATNSKTFFGYSDQAIKNARASFPPASKYYYTCGYCLRVSSRLQIEDHMARAHGKLARFWCPKCLQGFSRKEEMMLNFHDCPHMVGTMAGDLAFQCPICFRVLNSVVALRQHVKTHFRNGSEIPISSSDLAKEHEGDNESGKVMRDVCPVPEPLPSDGDPPVLTIMATEGKAIGHTGAPIIEEGVISKEPAQAGNKAEEIAACENERGDSVMETTDGDLATAVSKPTAAAVSVEGEGGEQAQDIPLDLTNPARTIVSMATPQDMTVCDKCGLVFDNQSDLCNHPCKPISQNTMANMHAPCEAPAPQNIVQECPECQEVFTKMIDLRRHIQNVHRLEPSTVINESNAVCKECSKIFTSRRGLQDHIRRVHRQEIRYTCTDCGQAFFSAYEYNEHRYLHVNINKSEVMCNVCKKVVKKSLLKAHMQLHSISRPYVCHICQKDFSFNTTLHMHLRNHLNEAPTHLCPLPSCGKTFKMKEKLEVHIAMHNREGKHFCSACGRFFDGLQAIQTHVCMEDGTLSAVEDVEMIYDIEDPVVMTQIDIPGIKSGMPVPGFSKHARMAGSTMKVEMVEPGEEVLAKDCLVQPMECGQGDAAVTSMSRDMISLREQHPPGVPMEEGNGTGMYQCSVCRATSASLEDMTVHVATHHADAMEEQNIILDATILPDNMTEIQYLQP